MIFTFLEAHKPLTKSYDLDVNGNITKTQYPTVAKFTSHKVECATYPELQREIIKRSALGQCLLKGNTKYDLHNESRAGSTDSHSDTSWGLLDFDKAPYNSVEEALASIHLNGEPSPFDDVSYIVQYSASHGLPGSVGLNCHVFFFLEEPKAAPLLKAWLIQLNLKSVTLKAGLRLNEAGTHISYPLDITTCQADKLIFLAPPVLSPTLDKHLTKLQGKSRFKEAERVQLVIKGYQVIPKERVPTLDPEGMRNMAHKIKNEMRVEKNLSPLRGTVKHDGDKIIMHGGTAYKMSETRTSNGFVTFNVNGGDSWSYYHPVDNYKYIGCFKHPGEYFETEKFLPEYHSKCEEARKSAQVAPTPEGETLLAFSDYDGAAYWRGTWNGDTQQLSLTQARSKDMLNDWMQQHGRDPLDWIPTVKMRFEPQKNYIVDFDNMRINTFVPTPYLAATYSAPKGSIDKLCPNIHKLMMHMLGITDMSDPLYEYWLNWWAVKYQTRDKVITSWLLRGIQGTGKNAFMEEVVKPTMGEMQALVRPASQLEQVFNGDWLEKTFVVLFDEIEIGSLRDGSKIQELLKGLITDRTATIRHMHRQSYSARNYTSFIFTSNKNEPLKLEDGDRRVNVGNFQHNKLYASKPNWAEEKKKFAEELPSWMAYIMTRVADIDMASDTIKNEARQNLIEVSRTSLDDVSRHLQQGNLYYFYGMMPDMELHAEMHGLNGDVHVGHYAEIIKRAVESLLSEGERASATAPWIHSNKLTREELVSLFAHTVGQIPTQSAKFTSFMRHRGINIVPVRHNGHLVRGIPVQWSVTPTQYDELRAWYDGTQKPKAVATVTPIKKARIA